MRHLVAAPLMAAVLAGTGCGGDGDKDAEAVRATIHAAIRTALVDHDLHRACGYATPRGTRILLHWYRFTYRRSFRSCEQVLRFELQQQQRNVVVPRLRRNLGVIGPSHVSATHATAQVTDHTGPYPDYVRVSLRKLSGHWLIDDSSAIPHGQ